MVISMRLPLFLLNFSIVFACEAIDGALFIWFEGEYGGSIPGGKVWMFGTRLPETESSMSWSRFSCLIEISCGMGGGGGRTWDAKLPAWL